MKKSTVVIFRRRPDTGSIIAVFTEEAADSDGWFLRAYEGGQPCVVDYYTILKTTKPATPEESAALAEELTRLGYTLRVVKRASELQHLNRFCNGRAKLQA